VNNNPQERLENQESQEVTDPQEEVLAVVEVAVAEVAVAVVQEAAEVTTRNGFP
jgi:hypothetical protein